jgi:hypothetical protein
MVELERVVVTIASIEIPEIGVPVTFENLVTAPLAAVEAPESRVPFDGNEKLNAAWDASTLSACAPTTPTVKVPISETDTREAAVTARSAVWRLARFAFEGEIKYPMTSAEVDKTLANADLIGERLAVFVMAESHFWRVVRRTFAIANTCLIYTQKVRISELIRGLPLPKLLA